MLHIWLMNQHSPLYVWQADKQTWHAHNDWQQVRDTYGNHSICLYFPSRHALQVSSDLSSAQLKQLGEAGKQYLFEETSLTAVEQLNVKDIRNSSSHYLYAVSQSDLHAWQQSAVLVGMDIVALLPDFLLLPEPQEGVGQQIVLYHNQYTTLLRQSDIQGMAVSYLPIVLERLPHLNEICLLTSTIVDNNLRTDLTGELGNKLNINDIRPDIVISTLNKQPMPITAPERHALNFVVKTSNFNLSPYLKITAIVAIIALVLQLATDGLQWYQYQHATTATEQAISEQYNAWFPNEPRNQRVDLRVQIKPKLATDGQTEAEYMAMLSRIAPLIKQSSLVAQSLIIEPTTLTFTLIGDNRDSLDKFASILVSQGISASLGSINSMNNNNENKVTGQITINLPSAQATS